jgi:hypothetical protein
VLGAELKLGKITVVQIRGKDCSEIVYVFSADCILNHTNQNEIQQRWSKSDIRPAHQSRK